MRRRSPLLEGLGRAVRAAREEQELTRQALAERAGVSLRYLAQLEGGTGNISVSKLDDVARELGMPGSALLAPRGEPGAGLLGPPGEPATGLLGPPGEPGAGLLGPPGEPAAKETGSGLLREIVGTLAGRPLEELREVLSHLRGSAPSAGQGRVIALMGLRGAGKSTLGPLLAERLAVPFHELDRLIEETSALALSEIFEMHGESYYREAERAALRSLIARGTPAVVAVSGGIVTDPEAFALLKRDTLLVWVKATPELHLARVEAQGDFRPIRNRPNVMAELKALLHARLPLYRQAPIVVDTAAAPPEVCVEALAAELSGTAGGI